METFFPAGSIAIIAALAATAHVTSAFLAGWRLRPSSGKPPHGLPPVTLIRPVCGLDRVERETLASTFRLPMTTEVIFCAARETDAAVPFLRSLMAQNMNFNARILIGHDGPGANPKLDNVRKGWRAAHHEWVVIADSNVLMDETYLWNMLSAWGDDVGAVCAPPFGVAGVGLWAEVETQFLNAYQARWQYAADAIGQGFAQGKSMLFRKSQLNAWGGIEALDIDIAEDAATTKVVRQQGLRVRLAPTAIPQPLGLRSFDQVWQRQCRWAQLRRQSFPALYALEPLTMMFPVLLIAALGATALEVSPTLWCAIMAIFWIAVEVGMARSAGWEVTMQSIGCAILREVLSPLLWLAGWRLRRFAWRQTTPSVLKTQTV